MAAEVAPAALRRLWSAARTQLGTAQAFTHRARASARRSPHLILNDALRTFAPLFTNGVAVKRSTGYDKAMPWLKPRSQPFSTNIGGRLSGRAAGAARGSTASTVGIGSARTFATGQPVLATVFANVPLGVRAIALGLGDVDKTASGGVRLARHAHRVGQAAAMKQAKMLERESSRIQQWRVAVEQAEEESESVYFVTEPLVASSDVAEPTVRLIIPLHPSLPSSSLSSSPSLLPRSSLHDLRNLQHALVIQQNRVANLADRLEAAGAFTGAGGTMELHVDEGVQSMVLDLYAPWTIADVRQVLGIWPGDRLWFELIDLGGKTDDGDEGSWHDEVAQTLVLPTMRDNADSILSSPTESDIDLASILSSPQLDPDSSYHRELHDFLTSIDLGICLR